MRSIFQSEEFLDFISGIDLYEPFCFSTKKDGIETGHIQGFIQKDGGKLKQFFSRRAIVNGGPFFAENVKDHEVSALLKQCIQGLKNKAIYIETRNYTDYSRFRPLFENNGFIYEPHYDFIVDVRGEEPWEKRMESSRMRFIKSSLKAGAYIIESPTEQNIIDYYTILKDLYDNKVKTPLFPLCFFIKLYHSSFCRFVLVQYDNSIVGGTVCVYDHNAAYEWFVCGKDGFYKKVYPSILATYYAIKFAEENGCKYFDMMGAGAPGDGGYGVRDFKAKFGGELVEYGRFKYICNKPLYSLGQLAVRIMKR